MKKIVIIGDSTTADYTENSFPQQGWGFFLQKYVNEGIEVKNFARGGHSLKNFIYSEDYIEGKTDHNEPGKCKWNSIILPTISEGDLVIFCWGGINDMLQSRRDGYRETIGGCYIRDVQNISRESYMWIGEGLGTHSFFTLRSDIEEMASILRKMIWEVQEKQAIPVVIKGTGKYYKVHSKEHNVVSVSRKYADAVIDVAKACCVEYFDMGLQLEREFLENGYEQTMKKYFLPVSVVEQMREEKGIKKPLPPVDDNVHYNYRGAELICQKVVEALHNLTIDPQNIYLKK